MELSDLNPNREQQKTWHAWNEIHVILDSEEIPDAISQEIIVTALNYRRLWFLKWDAHAIYYIRNRLKDVLCTQQKEAHKYQALNNVALPII